MLEGVTVTDPNYTGNSSGTLKIHKAAASLVLGPCPPPTVCSRGNGDHSTPVRPSPVVLTHDGSSTGSRSD